MGLKGGIALITVLVIIAVIFVAAGSIILSSLSELKMARLENYSTKAFYLAEGGIQRGIFELKTNLSSYDEEDDFGGETYKTISGSAEDGTYSVKIYQPAHEEGSDTYAYRVDAEGVVSTIKRMVSQTVTVKVLGYWPYAFDYALFGDSGKMELKEGVTVTGDIYQGKSEDGTGNIELKMNATISGSAYYTGIFEAEEGATPQEGVNPDPEVPMPVFNTEYYQAKIGYAADNVAEGDAQYDNLDLAGGTVYVNGNVLINEGGVITGPGTLVVVKDMEAENNSSIGQDVTVIVGKVLGIEENSTVGGNAILYANESVEIKEQGVVTNNSAIITPGKVELKEGVVFNGIIYAGTTFEIKEDVGQGASITGSVVCGGGIEVKQGVSVSYDTSAFPDSPPPGFSGGKPIVDITTSAWKEIF